MALTTLGSARWADARDLKRAGMIGAQSGMILGEMPVKQKLAAAVAGLFSPFSSSSIACGRFLDCFRRNQWALVRNPHAAHTAIFAPTGAGKGVSFVIPELLTNPESIVVIDPKGENAKLTAKHRDKYFGHRPVMVDPYHVVTESSDTFNALDFILPDSPYAIDDCNDLAKAIVVTTGEEKEPHWNEGAEMHISGITATVVIEGIEKEGKRSLQTVTEIVSNPVHLDRAIRLMCESEAWGGLLARKGGQLGHFVDRERGSVLTTTSRHLAFLNTPAIAAVTSDSSFDPSDLYRGKMTIYLIVPPERIRAQSGFLRMMISSLLRAVVRGGLQ